MSKLDLNLYLIQMKESYECARETLEDINESYNEGLASEEECVAALSDFENSKLVYETALICINQLNKPRDKKKHSTDQFLKDWYDSTTNKWLKEGLYDENINVLQPIINKFKEIKNGKSN